MQELRPNLFALEERQLLSTIVVDNPTDTPAAGYTDLREAVAAAAADTTDDTITFDPSVFGTQQTITLTSGGIDLSKTTGTLTITGPGADMLSVSGNNASAVFGLATGTTMLSGLTVTGASDRGALINSGGTLTLTDGVVSDNTVSGGAVLNVQNGTTTLIDCSVSHNLGYVGAGVFNFGGLVTLTGCTISGNTAVGYGGGVANGYLSHSPVPCTMVLSNCTISDNTAGQIVGGMLNGLNATATLNNCTISNNSAPTSYIGGIANLSGFLNMANTIVAGNTAAVFPDAYGDITSQGNNLIGGADDSSGWTGSDLTGTDASPLNPLLAPLGNYGGSTQTMPPLPGSPAIASGNTSLILTGITTDQRGQSRTHNGTVDIGAVQTQGFTLAVTGGDAQTAQVNTAFTNALAVSVTADNGLDPVDGGILAFIAPTSDASAALSASSSVISGGTASVTATANGTIGGYSVTATATGVDGMASFGLSNVETPSLVVNLVSDTVDPTDGLTSLREAVAYAQALGGDQTITFDSSVFSTPQTITLTSGVIDITDPNGSLTIDGPGANLLTVSGNNASGVFQVLIGFDLSGPLAISGLSITGGNTDKGAALWNGGGMVTLTNCVISGNNSVYGALTTSYGGTTTLAQCTVSNNSGVYGGGVSNLSDSTTTLDGCEISGNSAFTGGGLDNGFANIGVSGAVMVLTNCTISGNSATYGGGMIGSYDNTATLTNCTIAGNHASDAGGFLNQAGSTTTLVNCTISGNNADVNGGMRNSSATLTLFNTIIAGNSANYAVPDAVGDFNSQGNNLIGGADDSTGWTGSDLTGTDAAPLNPLLAPLGYYGGPLQTMPVLPGSPAIDAGNASLVPSGVTADQRGLPRFYNGNVDIGAAESQGYTMTVTGGDGQSTLTAFAFGNPLTVSVVSNNPNDPVDGGVITFTGPASGASATLPPGVISGGSASVIATANAAAGSYTVTATANGIASPVSFTLTNVAGSLVVDTAGDIVDPTDGFTSLREAVVYAEALGGDQTVTFDPSVFNAPATITLVSGPLDLTDTAGTLTIAGPGANILSINGNNADRVFLLNGGSTVLSGLTLTGGSTGGGGAALWNSDGTAALINCVVSGNYGGYGVVTTAYGGTTSLTGCTINGNSGTYGGGVTNLNSGTTTLDGCTVSNNSAFTGGGLNNGFANFSTSGSTMVLTDCTISGNRATYGGGMIGSYDNTATLTNCTISGNYGTYFGGVLNQNGSTITLDNCTVSGNNANHYGGLGNPNATLNIANTIDAGNNAFGGAPDAYGDFSSQGNNLIGGADDSTGWTSSDLTGTDAARLRPGLAPLGDYGGPTKTMPPLPGSLAIAAGNTSLIPSGVTTDQRGLPRVVNGTVDIGAAETEGYTLIAASTSTPQSAITGLVFTNPLIVTVVPNNPNDPVNGGLITFTSPTSGASTTLTSTVAGINNGVAGVRIVANATAGTYNMTATAQGISTPAVFSLTNIAGSLVVNTTSDVLSPYDGVTSLREAIAYAKTLAGNQTITFDPSVFNTPKTITLTGGILNFADSHGSLTIAGPGANLLTVTGNNTSGVFAVQGFGITTTFASLSGVTITGGSSFLAGGLQAQNCNLTVTDCIISNNQGSNGGGVWVSSGNITMTNCVISNNTATSGGGGILSSSGSHITLADCTIQGNNSVSGGAGGGIYNTTSSLVTLTGTTLSNNTAADSGGGIYNVSSSTAVITNSVLSNNSAKFGGGICVLYSSSVTVTGSTLSNNSASNSGGGIFGLSGSTVSVAGSTISNNTATIEGGGLMSMNGGTVTLTSSTFSGNSASTAGGVVNVNGSFKLANTIVAGNTASTSDPDALGSFTSQGNNLIGGGDGSVGWLTSDLTGPDAAPLNPLLAPLGNYGGSTQTMPPLPGSPAIAAGNTSLIPSSVTTDQRGQPRTFNSTIDIGAVQTQGFTAAIAGGNNQSAPAGSAFGNPLVVSVSADNGLDPVNGGLLTFTPAISAASATLSGTTATISGGNASVSATANGTLGNYNVIAAGIGVDSPLSFSLSNTLALTTTTVASSIVSLVFGQSVTFTATVSSVVAGGTPTGTVTFMDGSTVLGSATLNSVAGNDQATFSTSSLSPGAHNITALYGADSYFKSSVSTIFGQSVSLTPQLQGGVLAIAGTASNAAITLTPSLPHGASTYSMGVSYTLGGVTTNFGPFAVSSIVVYSGSGSNAVIFNGTTGDDAFTIGNGTVTETAAQTTLFTVALNGVASMKFNGISGNDSLTGPDQTNAWVLSGANAGSVNGSTTFQNIANLYGGSDDDTFTFGATATLAGTINGGAGSNTLDYSSFTTQVNLNVASSTASRVTRPFSNIQKVIAGSSPNNQLTGPTASTTYYVTGANAGTINTLSFANFGTVIAGPGNDTFVFNNSGSITGSIDGLAGTNVIDESAVTSPVSLNLNTSTITGIGKTFVNIGKVIGGTGSNTLTGRAAASTYTITGTNTGTVGSFTFAKFGSLAGGSGNDLFKFTPTAVLTGGIDGGAGTNTLDYSAFTTQVNLNLATSTASRLSTGFTNIQSVIAGGSPNNQLTGPSAGTTYNITGANAGTINSLAFSNFGAIIAGPGNDTFKFSNSGSLSALLEGLGGTNVIDQSAVTSPLSLDLSKSTVTGIGGTFVNVAKFIGGTGNNTLTGPAAGTTYTINGTNTGTVGSISFSQFGNINGGAGENRFVLGNGVGLTGTINGGVGGKNWLDYSAYKSGVTVNLATGSATGFGSAISNIFNVRGGSGNDNLTGNSSGNILIGGGGTDTLTGGTGSSLLIGGTGADIINGGSGGDLIIGGSTSYDNNNAALDSILAEWQSADSYSTKINLIKNGGGLNGTNVLNLGTTVIDDLAANVLTGASGGKNWYFKGSKDNITQLQTGEQVN